MKYIFTLFIALLFFSNSFAQNYKEVKIFLEKKDDIQTLREIGLEFDHIRYDKNNALTCFLSDDEFQKLQTSEFSFEILIDDWFSYYENLPKLTESEREQFVLKSKSDFNVDGFGFGSMGGFFTMDEIYARLDSMYQLYPNIITQKYQIGTTILGRPIYAVKISDNPNVNENEPQAHFNALIHAREPQGMMTIMYYMYYLLENYGTDAEVTYLVNNREIYFVPLINPDGYEYNRQTNPNGGGMWRKNRRNNGDGSTGVDLNRNFGYQWGYNNSGSSGTPSSETYRGTAPFSEPETQAIRDLCNTKNFKTALNYHTYSNLLLYPWGYINSPSPDNALFVEYSTDMVQFNGYENGQPPVILYDVNGSTDDWMYGEQTSKPKIFPMTPEVGSTGFWPSQGEIFPLAIENLFPNLYYTWAAGEFISLNNASFSQQYFNPGDNVQLTIPSVSNKGLSDAFGITLSLSSDNPDVTITNGSVSLGNINSRTTINNNEIFSFTIGNNVPADVRVNMLVTVSTNGTPMFVDTMSFITGTPVVIFADTTNNPIILWDITATPSTPRWDFTTTSYHSAPNSYTDSKTGSYVNNATVTMTSKNPIDLSTYSNARFSFWTRFDIESNWDYGQVEISLNNGSSWAPLTGSYTEPGTGSFQPNGEPLYDGTQTDWVQEDISLSGLNSAQIKFKYELRTDGSVTRDGWYVDDITVYVYGIVPVELSSFEAAATEKNVLLSWSTSTELNNAGFEIQRKSLTNQTGWQKLGFVNGNGTTTGSSSYSFIDENPVTGTSLYRLKQIDFDGSFKIFNSVSVNFEAPTEYTLSQNYPNPFNPNTIIDYSLAKAGFVTLKVYNLLGAEIATLVNDYQEAGNHSVNFTIDDYKDKIGSGVYFYKLVSEGYIQTRKMIILK